MSVELKIKSKHLSEEAKIIRHEEKKELEKSYHFSEYQKEQGNNDVEEAVFNFQRTYRSLHTHRCVTVRNENRATFLARAYIKGLPYSAVENSRKDESVFKCYIFPKVVDMVARYGKTPVTKLNFERKLTEDYKNLREDIKKWATI